MASPLLPFEIRPERPDDFERVEAVVAAAFESDAEARLVSALRKTTDPQLSRVAVRIDEPGEILGHIFYSPVTIVGSGPSIPVAQLSPLAVDTAHQRRGIGAALVRESLVACASIGWKAVFLVGNPAYYRRFGFEMAKPLGFSLPGPLDPFLQVREIESGALDGITGRIELAAAFDELDENSKD
jgi:putative acetyltransferase